MITLKKKTAKKTIRKSSIIKTKVIKAKKYAGKISWGEDALVYQKNARNEWQ